MSYSRLLLQSFRALRHSSLSLMSYSRLLLQSFRALRRWSESLIRVDNNFWTSLSMFNSCEKRSAHSVRETLLLCRYTATLVPYVINKILNQVDSFSVFSVLQTIC